MAARPHEAGLWRRDAGAERPPFCFWALLRSALLAKAVILACAAFSPSDAATGCRYFDRGVSSLEWLDGSKPHGAKLVLGNEWQGWGTPHGLWISYKPATDSRVRGWLMLGLPPDFNSRDTEKGASEAEIEAALQPPNIELAIGMFRGVVVRIDLVPVGDAEPIEMFGLKGRTRLVTRAGETHPTYARAIALGDGCFSMFGLFSTIDGDRLSPANLYFLNSTISLERYEPILPHPALSPKNWSFENFRRALGLDQPDGKQ